MKQPNWKRWEVILLVDLYFRVNGCSSKVLPECEKLSRVLRRSNIEYALLSSTYRNEKGILMKYQNIRHIVEGKGLSQCSKLDVEIVELHQTNPSAFNQELELQRIQNCINQ